MNKAREIYKIDQLPIFQNRMYDSKEEAISYPKGDICIVEDLETGLVYNAVFSPELMVYDNNYQAYYKADQSFLS